MDAESVKRFKNNIAGLTALFVIVVFVVLVLRTYLLAFSADVGNYTMSKFWISVGADVNGVGDADVPLLAALGGKHNHIVRLLLDKGASPNFQRNDGEKPILLANRGRNKEAIRMLIDHGANINETDEDGNSLLMLAVMYKKPDLVDFLLSMGADPDKRNNKKETPAQVASRIRNPQIMETIKTSLTKTRN